MGFVMLVTCVLNECVVVYIYVKTCEEMSERNREGMS